MGYAPPNSAATPRAQARGVHEVVRTRSRPPPHQSLKPSLGDGPRSTRRPRASLFNKSDSPLVNDHVATESEYPATMALIHDGLFGTAVVPA